MHDALIVYVDTNGHANVPRSYVTHQGDGLGAWLHRQRTLARQQRLPPKRHEHLTAAGVQWTMSDRTAALAAFARFVDEHGHGLVPHAYRDSHNFPLGCGCNRVDGKTSRTLPQCNGSGPSCKPVTSSGKSETESSNGRMG
ncbi:helicase associated domain-containing protein [Frigoribacterium sp. NBH87]|uniref:helicase associated domain-containing protein n=1 Tax=Frigoribacterium sp. NBH87 TaxID=2596916 RepID=UPI00351C2448